ncbi:hypothetical protein [Asticcacaulis excentricus]|uniref:Uncharacterized protein n=1 Tax=Asticcacaulis excentricus (strain ATCC 15261 / DSM 4724 / KCTC 12464 / NCIMB 9791 / VKM B-1370 / CB 48) TaxID=573065 RepID=E8RMM7_ASTEC|nr:hypothetical protein [Asticcacaulis excentricus]ADU13908.1 hypothetical protein Astex_2253 [Asticcacaulis excentricus CB 48]
MNNVPLPAHHDLVLDWRMLETALMWIATDGHRDDVRHHISTLMELSQVYTPEQITGELILRIGLLTEEMDARATHAGAA